jgi:hypothetical protein
MGYGLHNARPVWPSVKDIAGFTYGIRTFSDRFCPSQISCCAIMYDLLQNLQCTIYEMSGARKELRKTIIFYLPFQVMYTIKHHYYVYIIL